ncbi:hypothetical protein [Thermostilla marina]
MTPHHRRFPWIAARGATICAAITGFLAVFAVYAIAGEPSPFRFAADSNDGPPLRLVPLGNTPVAQPNAEDDRPRGGLLERIRRRREALRRGDERAGPPSQIVPAPLLEGAAVPGPVYGPGQPNPERRPVLSRLRQMLEGEIPAVEGLIPEPTMPAPGALPPDEPAPFALQPYPVPSSPKTEQSPTAENVPSSGPMLKPALVSPEQAAPDLSAPTENDHSAKPNEAKVSETDAGDDSEGIRGGPPSPSSAPTVPSQPAGGLGGLLGGAAKLFGGTARTDSSKLEADESAEVQPLRRGPTLMEIRRRILRRTAPVAVE